jgi:hypothetical protein
MHNGTVGLDWPLHHAVSILEVDDEDLWLGAFVDFLPYANKVIGFEGTRVEAY